MMYKIINNAAPIYLQDLLPPYVGQRQPYNLRNADDITAPFCRNKSLKNSFIPRTIALWNDYINENDISEIVTISAFKNKLHLKKSYFLAKLFNHGIRY